MAKTGKVKIKPLDKRQARFVEEYIIDFHGGNAAIRAGYSGKNASSCASTLLKNPSVTFALAQAIKARSRRTEVTQDNVLHEIACIAFHDPRNLFDENNCLLPVHSWPDESAAAVSAIKVSEIFGDERQVVGYTKEIKFWDKGKQLDLAARHLGMLKDNLNLTGIVQLIATSEDVDI